MPNIIIYDHRCGYCIMFMRAVRRFDAAHRFRFYPFESLEGQALLRAQFGRRAGFTMYVFTDRTVYWGQGATHYILKSLGFSEPVTRWAEHLYPVIVTKVSKLTGRKRKVSYPKRGFSAAAKPKVKKLLTSKVTSRASARR